MKKKKIKKKNNQQQQKKTNKKGKFSAAWEHVQSEGKLALLFLHMLYFSPARTVGIKLLPFNISAVL